MKRTVFILALALSALSVMAQTMVVKDKSFYQSKTFTWTDANGASHTNTLVDVATDPRHIMALLKEVYTNKTIPGIKYANRSNGSGNGFVDYQVDSYSNLSKGWGVEGGGSIFDPNPNGGDYTPNEEGYTTILIKVKQNFVSSTEACQSEASTLRYIASAIESAQVVCGTYINGEKPGALYKFEGDASHFFMLSKGRARSIGSNIVRYAPFYGMFEEYSPTVADYNMTITDFYARMMQGELYYVVHDCGSVFDMQHEFNMTTDKDVRPLDDVAFYIPDNRFAAWGGRDYQGGNYIPYTNYNPDYAPVLGMYTIKLTAKGEQADNEDEWKVTLNWTSNLNAITGCDVPQTYYVYVRNDDGSLEPLLDENGNQVTTDNVTSYTYNEKKGTSERNITYVVSGRPKDNSFSVVYSNDASVVVPPMGQSKWDFTIGVTPYSDFDVDNEINQYKNYVKLFSDIDAGSINTYFNMGVAPQFTVYRYPLDHTFGYADKVATVNITSVTGSGSNTRCGYSVTYDNQDNADEAAYPAKTGTFSFDGEMLQVCDQFSASTAINAHPESYEYCVVYGNNKGESLSSAMAKVKVFKTIPESNTQVFTKTYVDADSSRMAHAYEEPLDLSAPKLTFNTENNSKIYYYKALMRDVEGTMQELGRAQRMPSGNYMVYGGAQQTKMAAAGAQTAVASEDVFGIYDLTPVIYTFREGTTNDYNTYGAPIRRVTRVGVEVQEVQLQVSDFTFTDANGNTGRYYKSILNIPTQGASLDGEIVRYRVWRVTPDGKAMEVVPQYMARLNQDAHPADMYVYAGGPVLHPSCRNEFVVAGENSRSAESCLPTRYDENTITFVDVFGAKALGDGEEMPVTYVARVYTESGMIAPVQNYIISVDTESLYCIAENSTVVKFNNSIPTAVMDIDTTAKTPLHVQYVNMLGCTSDQPFSGVNIVVTTFTDGTMVKEKKVF